MNWLKVKMNVINLVLNNSIIKLLNLISYFCLVKLIKSKPIFLSIVLYLMGYFSI